jgi:hypothetical protein
MSIDMNAQSSSHNQSPNSWIVLLESHEIFMSKEQAIYYESGVDRYRPW